MTRNESAGRSVHASASIRWNAAHAHMRTRPAVVPGPCFICASVTVTFIAGFWLCQDCAELVTSGNDDAHTDAHTRVKPQVRAVRLDSLSRGFGLVAA